MRTVTLREYLMETILEDLNERARKRGEDVEVVLAKPGPKLATDRGEVVQLYQQKDASR
jgi:hypothetical protein